MSICTIWLGIFGVAGLLAADQDAEHVWNKWVKQTDALHKQGNLTEAADLAKRALAVAKTFGQSDPRLATNYFVLGSIYRDWGHCAEARSNYLHSIALFEKQADAKPQYLFNAIVGLISQASECEDFKAAEKSYRAHAAVLQRTASGRPVDEARLLAILGGIARGHKRYAEAESYFERSLQLQENTPGSTPEDVAELRSSIAVMMDHQGRYQESLAQLESAIAVFKKRNPRYLTLPAIFNNAACALAHLGRNDESERMYQRAVDLARELYGEDNRNTATIMLNYAALLRDKKETPAADALKKRGTDAYRRSMMHEAQTVDVSQLGRAR